MSEIANPLAPPINRLLAALPIEEYQRMLPALEHTPLTFNTNIYAVGERIGYVYFPNSGIVSLLASVTEQAMLEVGLVGSEGLVGLPVFLGVANSNTRAVVQGDGSALRMTTRDFQAECERDGALSPLLRRYTHLLLTQISQSAVCYRFHSIDARLARWLLMMHDRMGTSEFKITHAFLSDMVGVRREAVTIAAGTLQQQNLIRYSRGSVSILNRTALEAAACSCYGVIKAETEAVFLSEINIIP